MNYCFASCNCNCGCYVVCVLIFVACANDLYSQLKLMRAGTSETFTSYVILMLVTKIQFSIFQLLMGLEAL